MTAVPLDAFRAELETLRTAAATALSAATDAAALEGARVEFVGARAGRLKAIQKLLGGLDAVAEEGASLLDHTMVLYGSCMGNANSHANVNLPILLAGGGFRHAGHLAFDPADHPPLANLYVSMLQRLGVETDRFATSTGTLTGLEAA